MIDRKALWISAAVILAMSATALWRLSLLPDWDHMPVGGTGNSHTVNGLFLFIEPAVLLFIAGCAFVQRWLVSGPEESLPIWRRWSGWLVVSSSALTALIQAFMIARSLGIGLAIDRLTFAHALSAAAGILLILLGNALPKMPRLSARFRPIQLNPWQWNREARFKGRLLVGLGLFFAIGPSLLPQKMVFPAMIGLWLAMFVAGMWYRAKVKREPSPLP